MVSLIADDEEQGHAVAHYDEQPHFLVTEAMLQNFGEGTIQRYRGRKENHHAVNSVHVRVSTTFN